MDSRYLLPLSDPGGRQTGRLRPCLHAAAAHAEDVDYELLDFYIAPNYRRLGVGRQAARMVFEQHHGRWVVYELAKNLPARVFWQAVIGEYTHGQYENLDGGIEPRFSN